MAVVPPVVLAPNGPVIFDFPLCRFVRRRLVRFVTGVSVVFKNFQQDWLSNVRNDVLAAEKLAKQIDPNALILKLANPARDQPTDWPQATVSPGRVTARKARLSASVAPEVKTISRGSAPISSAT